MLYFFLSFQFSPRIFLPVRVFHRAMQTLLQRYVGNASLVISLKPKSVRITRLPRGNLYNQTVFYCPINISPHLVPRRGIKTSATTFVRFCFAENSWRGARSCRGRKRFKKPSARTDWTRPRWGSTSGHSKTGWERRTWELVTSSAGLTVRKSSFVDFVILLTPPAVRSLSPPLSSQVYANYTLKSRNVYYAN